MSETETETEHGKLTVAKDFLVDTRHEMEKVSWPGRPELTASTRAVVIGSLVLGVTIGLIDKLLTLILINGVGALSR
jgi:preprotein translocase SecE subunit